MQSKSSKNAENAVFWAVTLHNNFLCIRWAALATVVEHYAG